MARRRVNKSELVRQYLTKHPDAGPTEVAIALKNHKIPPAYVSNIKFQMSRRAERASARGAMGGDTVVAAARFIKACGGVEQARKALDTAQKVVQELG
jgi:hypothetical protein